MEPRLTRGEYWLLEVVVEHGYPLSYLCYEEYREPKGLEQVFNKPGHGLDRDALIATLASLLRDGLIETHRNDEPCLLDETQISDCLSEKRPLENPSCAYYRLTTRGASIWETFAAPEWDRYILHDYDDESRTGTATCTTHWRLKKFLSTLYLVGQQVNEASITIEACGDWSPTYWKKLPSGHRAHFQWLPVDHWPADELQWLAFAGFCEFRDGWYRWR